VVRGERWLAVFVLSVSLLCFVGCDVIEDPTSQSFAITFHNDTGRLLRLKLCSDSECRHFNYSHQWSIGESGRENISDAKVFTRWLVEDADSGDTLGCIPLEFDQKYSGVVVDISQMVDCPGERPLVPSVPGSPR
jgi:hypothetical protein